MSLFSTMNTGASGLGVSSTYLQVIGDNIANINTIGFKGSRASFADFIPQHVFGMAGGGQIGTGAVTNNVQTLFGGGSIEATSEATDMAINGNGFFVVNDGRQSYYTRAGTFGFDDDGYLVAPGGFRVQGYSGEAGTLSSVVGDIQRDQLTVPAEATSTLTIDANLSAEVEVGTELAALDFYGTGAGSSTLTDAASAADFSTSATVYDSLGVAHEVTVLFERSGTNGWTWRAVTDASQVYDSTGTAVSSDSDAAFEIAQGTLTFDSEGALTGFTQTDTSDTNTWTFGGSDTPGLSFDFGLDEAGAVTDGSIAMSGDESSVSNIDQDGYAQGDYDSVAVGDDGSIVVTYTNGQELTIGQVALATFASPQSLDRIGGTLFTTTPGSGDPAIGVAGSGGRGAIQGGALERSNVDLEAEFVAMITAQRSYQANSRVISTANETLASLMQLI
jgi:flagellar hook protein FlgE